MKYIFISTRIFSILLLTFALQLSSCKKDDDDSGTPITPSGATLKTTVTGKVTDTDNNIVIGVTVVLGTKTTTTDSRGHFLFENTFVPKDRLVIKGSKQGFFDCIKGKKTQTGGVNYINLVIEELPAAVNISGVSGGVVTIPGGASITFPANAFIDANGNAYTGIVKVFSRHFNPASPGFADIIPGGDLIGTNIAGQPRSLYSLGMIEALLKDNSGVNEIKLATGITAQLRFPIDPSQTAEAQSTIPLWYLNETTGVWKEEGEAIKNGNFFEGNVSHFSTWNCDYQGERTDIVGKVLDCNAVPMANIVVTINGFMNVVTDNAGNYSTWVPAGYTISCQVLQINNPVLALNSPAQTITAVGGILNNIPVLIVSCVANVSGMIKLCDSQNLVSGIIFASWQGGSAYHYAHNGYYNIPIPENTHIDITASISGFNGYSQTNSGISGTIVTAPDIFLCNPVTNYLNKFTVTENGISTEYIFIWLDETLSSADLIDDNFDGTIDRVNISIAGNVMPGNKPCYVYIDLPYFWNAPSNLLNGANSAGIEIDSYFFESFSFDPDSVAFTSNQVHLYDLGLPFIVNTSGSFEFDCMNSSRITNGEFTVERFN